MRVIATLLALIAACRFDPTGGLPPAEDGAVTADAAPADAAALDAMVVIDARPVDARPVDARPACPASYDVSHPSGRYTFRPIAMQHALAKIDCEDDLPGRTHLATFENPLVMTAAIDLVNPGNSATPWVGARCVGPDCGLTLAWLWDTLLPVSSTLWAELQPDNGTTEKVARAQKARADGDWALANVVATSTLPYICECDP